MSVKKYIRVKGKEEKGYTLLEYTAGAAVILVIVWAALNAFGTSMSGLLGAMGTWANDRATDIGGAQDLDNP